MENARTLVEQLLTEITGGRKTIAATKYLVDDLGFDSLKMVDLMLAVEERLDVVIPIADASRIHTVADLYAAVERMLQAHDDLPAPPPDSSAKRSAPAPKLM
jgi:acyl carrier protein